MREFKVGDAIYVNFGKVKTPKYVNGTITKISSDIYTVKTEDGKSFKFSSTERFKTMEDALKKLPPIKEVENPSSTVIKNLKSPFYFAYGSNMSLKQMKHRCQTAELMGKAVLKNYQFIINQRGVASVIPKKNSIVYGLVFKLQKEDEDSLDLYEGVKNGFYYKKYLDIVAPDKNGVKIDALVYIAENNKFGKPRPNYLENIIEVSKKLFPKEYIEELESWL